MMRLKSDLLPVLHAAATGALGAKALDWSDGAALTVVMASEGYPASVRKGTIIRGLEAAEKAAGVRIFHAGTKRDAQLIVANGGRVLNVTASGSSVSEAQRLAYGAVALIDWPEGFCRSDIGWRAVERESAGEKPDEEQP